MTARHGRWVHLEAALAENHQPLQEGPRGRREIPGGLSVSPEFRSTTTNDGNLTTEGGWRDARQTVRAATDTGTGWLGSVDRLVRCSLPRWGGDDGRPVLLGAD